MDNAKNIVSTSSLGILSALLGETIVINRERCIAGVTEGAGKCPSTAQVDYTIFGGTPPCSVASIGLAITTAEPDKVGSSGGRFRATLSGFGQGSFSITDATGKAIQSVLIDSQRGGASTITAAAQTLLVSPIFPESLNVARPKSFPLTTKASATIAGAGNFVAVITTSVPSDSDLVMSPSSDALTANLTFTQSVSTTPL